MYIVSYIDMQLLVCMYIIIVRRFLELSNDENQLEKILLLTIENF